MGIEILVMRGEDIVHSRDIRDAQVVVGRAPGNGLVLAVEQVSWHHAVFWIEGGRLWVKDLGSTNGTFLNEERIKEPTVVPLNAKLKLGPSVELRIRGALEQADETIYRVMSIEELDSGVSCPLQSDRVYIGSGADCALRIEGAPERVATLVVHDNGEVWLGSDEGEQQLELDEPFAVAGMRYVLREGQRKTPTALAERVRYPYRLTVSLQGATGPEASIEDIHTGKSCAIRSSNRVVLLYILARQLRSDRTAGRPATHQGWCSDEEVSSGVWGRNWQSHASSHLHVLVHRLRKQIKAAGFDPWFIEKKQRHIRMRAQDVIIED